MNYTNNTAHLPYAGWH